jgi:hypothetical protein
MNTEYVLFHFEFKTARLLPPLNSNSHQFNGSDKLYLTFGLNEFRKPLKTTAISYPWHWDTFHQRSAYRTYFSEDLRSKNMVITCYSKSLLNPANEKCSAQIDFHTLATGPQPYTVNMVSKDISETIRCRVSFNIEVSQIVRNIAFRLKDIDITQVYSLYYNWRKTNEHVDDNNNNNNNNNNTPDIARDLDVISLNVTVGYIDPILHHYNYRHSEIDQASIDHNYSPPCVKIKYLDLVAPPNMLAKHVVRSSLHILFWYRKSPTSTEEFGRIIIPFVLLFSLQQYRRRRTTLPLLLKSRSTFRELTKIPMVQMKWSTTGPPRFVQLEQGEYNINKIEGKGVPGFELPSSNSNVFENLSTHYDLQDYLKLHDVMGLKHLINSRYYTDNESDITNFLYNNPSLLEHKDDDFWIYTPVAVPTALVSEAAPAAAVDAVAVGTTVVGESNKDKNNNKFAAIGTNST